MENSFSIFFNDDKCIKLNNQQLSKIKYLKHQQELFKIDNCRLDVDYNLFVKIYNFIIKHDNVELTVNITEEYSMADKVIKPEAIAYFDEWTLEDIVELINLCVYIEYPFLMEVATKKVALLMLGSMCN